MILIVRSRNPGHPKPAGNFYAPRILAQFDTCLHRYCESNDGYSRALFIRYGDLLRRDLNQILAVGALRARAWCWVFRIWHGILSTGVGWRAFGRRTEGLRVLATALISATGSRPTSTS